MKQNLKRATELLAKRLEVYNHEDLTKQQIKKKAKKELRNIRLLQKVDYVWVGEYLNVKTKPLKFLEENLVLGAYTIRMHVDGYVISIKADHPVRNEWDDRFDHPFITEDSVPCFGNTIIPEEYPLSTQIALIIDWMETVSNIEDSEVIDLFRERGNVV